jgi:hypothetical protein
MSPFEQQEERALVAAAARAERHSYATSMAAVVKSLTSAEPATALEIAEVKAAEAAFAGGHQGVGGESKGESAAGCHFVRHGKGDHEIWYSPLSGISSPVDADIKSRHTANGVLKQAGLPKQF